MSIYLVSKEKANDISKNMNCNSIYISKEINELIPIIRLYGCNCCLNEKKLLRASEKLFSMRFDDIVDELDKVNIGDLLVIIDEVNTDKLYTIMFI